eukprot:9930913-Alexandrium_andersonii.AAC.1
MRVAPNTSTSGSKHVAGVPPAVLSLHSRRRPRDRARSGSARRGPAVEEPWARGRELAQASRPRTATSRTRPR